MRLFGGNRYLLKTSDFIQFLRSHNKIIQKNDLINFQLYFINQPKKRVKPKTNLKYKKEEEEDRKMKNGDRVQNTQI